MTLTLVIALLGLVLVDTDLLALAVLNDSGLHLRALHHRSAELGVFAVNDRQNLIEGNGVARLDGELLNEQGVALVTTYCLPPVTMIACIACTSFLNYGLAVGGVRKVSKPSETLSPFKAAVQV